ncbi:hypothetical protein ACFLRR_01270 [Bacteroidota bacterium]
MSNTNIDMLQTVANGLGELKNDMVFVGGAVAELYASDPAASDIRPTLDVDCVIELSSRTKLGKLEENLRERGFAHDTTKGAPICRFVFKDIKVDVMPTDEKLLGFSNRWYVEGIQNKIIKILPDETEIFVFSPEYYLAAKFEAHESRGGEDLRQSHDFEDIIYIIHNCTDLRENIRIANASVKTYLKEKCQSLLENDNLSEGIECVIPYGSGDDSSYSIEGVIYDISEII